jgi:hypothetical protein
MTHFLATTSSATLFWMLYAAVAPAMLVGLIHGRAPGLRPLLWPLSAALVTALIGASPASSPTRWDPQSHAQTLIESCC